MIEADFKPIVEDSFDDKMKYIQANVHVDPYINGAVLLKIVSLLCFIVVNNRKKVNPEFSVVDALNLVCGDHPKNMVYAYFKERLPLICEIFLQDSDAKFDTYGLKTRDEILKELLKLIDSWLPF